MVGAAIISAVSEGLGWHLAAYGEYEKGVEAQRQAEANAELARQQAAAQQAQAAEYERQAKLENEKAGVDQLQGELEASKRARLAAQEIGSTYATAAGNGVLVSGSTSDTFANVLKSQTQESSADIGIIKANTAMNVWSREENAKSLLFQGSQSRVAANSSLYSAAEYERQGEAAYKAGVISAAGTYFQGMSSTIKGSAGSYWGKK